MNNVNVYDDSFDIYLKNLLNFLQRCIEMGLVLTFEKCHFMVVTKRGLEVDKATIDILKSLPNPKSIREAHSFLINASFFRRFIKDFSKIIVPMYKSLQRDVDFEFGEDCKKNFRHAENSTYFSSNYLAAKLEFAIRDYVRRKQHYCQGCFSTKKRKGATCHL